MSEKRRRRPVQPMPEAQEQEPEGIKCDRPWKAEEPDRLAMRSGTGDEAPAARRGRKKPKRSAARDSALDMARQAGRALAALFAWIRSAAIRGAKLACRHARLILIVLLCGVMLFSLWQIGSILLRSIRTRQTNAELSALRQSAGQAAVQEESMPSPETDTEQTETIIETPLPAPEQESMPEETAQDAPTEALQDTVASTKYQLLSDKPLPKMEELYNKNHDLVAWIEIPDVIDLPVVYEDNQYYLKRDFYKQKNNSGTIFLDENHPFREKTQNLLLHGHNMKDGTMFGRLTHYLTDISYLKSHPFIRFDTLWREEQYVIFAVLDVSLDVGNERFFNYFTHSTFFSDAEFEHYIRSLQLRSDYAIPIDVVPSDALLTLSTCLDEDRLVIVARRLREGESRSELRALIRASSKQ